MIANIERVSNLFLTKTTYATLLAIVTVIVGWPYPFLPRQSTIVNGLTIGIPAFFLALAPNTQRYVPGFVRRVLRFAIPAGVDRRDRGGGRVRARPRRGCRAARSRAPRRRSC